MAFQTAPHSAKIYVFLIPVSFLPVETATGRSIVGKESLRVNITGKFRGDKPILWPPFKEKCGMVDTGVRIVELSQR